MILVHLIVQDVAITTANRWCSEWRIRAGFPSLRSPLVAAALARVGAASARKLAGSAAASDLYGANLCDSAHGYATTSLKDAKAFAAFIRLCCVTLPCLDLRVRI